MEKKDCEQCRDLPEGEVVSGHDHSKRYGKGICKEECFNRRQHGSSRCEFHVGIKRKIIPQTHGAD